MLRNLVKTSLAAAKRVFQLHPPTEQHLLSLHSEASLAGWQHYSDTEFGGLSTSSLELSSEKTGVFSGNLSLDLHPDKVVQIKRSGFAGINTRRGHAVFDLSPFNVIEMRLKGDGRSYVSSLRTENWIDKAMVDDNTWHHPIHTNKDEWKVHKFELADYKRTYHGRIIVEQVAMNPNAIVGMGFHVTAHTPHGAVQGPGPYRLELDWIRAVKSKSYYRS